MKNTRACAVQVLISVIDGGEHFNPSLLHRIAPSLSSEDQGFVHRLCYGVLRFYYPLMAMMRVLMTTPMKAKDRDLQLLLLVGLYQLCYLDTPEYAALHESVEAVKVFKKEWARSLINGVLRNAQRQKDRLLSDQTLFTHVHPSWLQKAIKNAWPDHWQAILSAHLAHPPFSLRIATSKISREAFAQRPEFKDDLIETMEHCPTGIYLSPPRDVSALPGFQEGWVSVQDGAAQLAAPLLAVEAHQRVLDACAAPGGKTAHLLETIPTSCEVWALEEDPKRVERLKDTLSRCALKAKVICADANQIQDWWDGTLFDRILLDVPCSATGVIRRHPDIPFHRKSTDIAAVVAQQQALLSHLWPLLKSGGILLYVTCSLLPAENRDQMTWFLAQHADAEEWPIDAPWGLPQTVGRQILPGQDNMDGFYYARLRKK